MNDDYQGIDVSSVSSFGTVICEFDQSKGWIESTSFSPNGFRFAFCGHDSTLHFGSFEDETNSIQTLQRSKLPFRTIAFLTDTILVAGGYDCVPVIYEYEGDGWKEKGPLDTGMKRNKKNDDGSGMKNKNVRSAFAKFQKQDRLGKDSAEDSVLKSRHQNMISDIRVASTSTFTTSSVDGRVLHWDISQKY